MKLGSSNENVIPGNYKCIISYNNSLKYEMLLGLMNIVEPRLDVLPLSKIYINQK